MPASGLYKPAAWGRLEDRHTAHGVTEQRSASCTARIWSPRSCTAGASWQGLSCRPACLQGEAIAVNLREMFGLTVPLISIVIGEGGSGGALAIGCSNWNLIMEHSVYYVASPEACAAILWKSRDRAPTVGPCTHGT